MFSICMSSIPSSSTKSTFWFGPRLVDEAACGDFVAVRGYLKAGDDVNERNHLGGSALIVAAQYNHIEVLRILLRDQQIDVNLQDDSGETALMKAASEGHTEIVKTLCRRRDLDVNIQDSTGWTTLMHARGKQGIVKTLLKVPKLDLTLRDDTKSNALHRACSKGWTKAATAMIRNKRVVQQLSMDDFEYAEFLAKDKGYTTITKLISKAASVKERNITRTQVTG